MKTYLRIIFSVISLIIGFFSLDFLYYAFKLLTDAGYDNAIFNMHELYGFLMFAGWIVVFTVYLLIIKRLSIKVSIIEQNPETGKQKFKYKWFDVYLQITFIITGILLKWIYLSLYYLKRI